MRTPDAQAEYRHAFEQFSKKAQRVQLLAAQNTGGVAFETALLELESAQLAYNQARDAFLRSLQPDSAHIPAVGKIDFQGDVPAIAELIWESEGRPEGTAEEDWLRAEAIVKRAVELAPCH